MLKIQNKLVDELIEYDNNPRLNDEAVDVVAKSIKEFGFKVPVIIDENNIIVAGHTRVKACKRLGIKEVPCIIADDLTDDQLKAFRLADNKTHEFALWDDEKLSKELEAIKMDMFQFGFEDLDNLAENEVFDDEFNEDDYIIEKAYAQREDIFILGKTRLMSGDSTRSEERRVGKECRSRWSPYLEQKKTEQ